MVSIRWFELAIALAVMLMVPPLWAAAPGTIFCCDIGGQPVCGDILPPACYGRGYREIAPQGTLLRYVPAPLTAEEAARRERDLRERREAELAVLRQRRLDRALLDTYPTEAVLIARRDRELAEADRTIADLRVRERDLLARKAKLLEEAEFYKGKPLPQGLSDDLANLDGEVRVQRSVIAMKQGERDAMSQRFEDDRRRYVELTTPPGTRRR